MEMLVPVKHWRPLGKSRFSALLCDRGYALKNEYAYFTFWGLNYNFTFCTLEQYLKNSSENTGLLPKTPMLKPDRHLRLLFAVKSDTMCELTEISRPV